MAGRKQNASKAKGPKKQLKEKKPPKEEPEEDVGQRLTLEALDAISSDEDSVSGSEADTNMAAEAETDPEWDAEARALRQAIKEGAFDNIGVDKKDVDIGEKVEEELDQDEDQDSSEEEEIDEIQAQRDVSSGIALQAALEELAASDAAALPWVETLAVVPKDPLPFGAAGAEGNPIDVHDDLKREVAFYNLALQGVVDARIKCAQSKIPFSRPDDFFAEMVKTDEHMARVKDRLIFESKKIDAFEQRKSNKEHKLRSKEARSHKLDEKARNKRDHLKAVDDWAKSAAANRPSGGKVRDDDDQMLDRLNGEKSTKRVAMDRKYGHGGKKGRFKQTDSKSLNDMSQFNPRGNFSGGGQKKTGKPAAGGGGAKRQGKRARDASRSRG